MAGKVKLVRARHPRPHGHLIGGSGGLRGRSARARPAVWLAALATAGLLVAVPSPAHAATPSANPTASAKPCPAADVRGSGDDVAASNPLVLKAPDGGTWNRTFADGFTKPQASWGTDSSQTVVYTDDNGSKWVEYPDGWPSTYTDGNPGYQPAQVLSTHDNVLDFCLHSVTVNGQNLPSGANPSPLVTGTSQYQTYGRYTARIKSDAIPNYHAAILLWPVNDNKGACAESDFPETDLAHDTVTAFAHNATGNCNDYSVQDEFDSKTHIYDGAWHTYTQEWGPGFRKYYIDGQLLLDGSGHDAATSNIWGKSERWQLQLEPDCPGITTCTNSGHLLVDWVAAYSYAPPTTQTPTTTPAETAPATSEAAKAKEAGSVHPGASCSLPGAPGTTDTGTAMLCSGSPAHWRPA